MRAPPIVTAGLALLVLTPLALADGVVTVAPQGDTLTIRGDAGNNEISILPGPSASQIRIIPANGTTLNGFELPIDFTTPAGTLDIRLDGGDDIIVVTGGVDAGDLLVVLGTGSNSFAGTGSRVSDLTIDGSDLADQVTLTDFAVEGRFRLDLRGGDDIVTMLGTTAVGGKTTMEFGAGNDFLDLDGTNFGKQVKLVFDDGADQLFAFQPVFQHNLALTLRDGGADDLFFDDAIFRKKLKISCRDDALTLMIRDSDAAKGASIKCRAGNDTIEVSGTSAAKPLSIKTGDGADTIRLTGCQLAKRPKLLSGNGMDLFTVESNTFEKGALVNGGSDTDTQTNDIATTNTVNGGKLKVKSVEETD